MKLKNLLPLVFVLLFAALRWPGLLPPNFTAVYAFVFCAGVYFPKRLVWWLPLATMAATDLALNIFYYHVSPFSPEMVGNYVCYVILLGLGRLFSSKPKVLKVLAGGLLGAVLFYLITNTISWLSDPHYTKTFLGWLKALTVGTPGYPSTWEFFRNTLASGGLFTGLFAGAMKLLEALEPEEEEEEQSEPEPEREPEKAEA